MNRVACVDWTLKCVGIHHGSHIGQNHNIKKRSNARQDVLGVGCGGCNDMAVIASKRCDQRCDRLGQTMPVKRIFGQQNLGHPVDGRGFVSGSFRSCTCCQNGDVAQRLCGGHGFGCRIHCQRAVGDFGNQKNGHYTAPTSLSFATSSSTEPTLIPAARSSGSEVFTISRRGVISTP